MEKKKDCETLSPLANSLFVFNVLSRKEIKVLRSYKVCIPVMHLKKKQYIEYILIVRLSFRASLCSQKNNYSQENISPKLNYMYIVELLKRLFCLKKDCRL